MIEIKIKISWYIMNRRILQLLESYIAALWRKTILAFRFDIQIFQLSNFDARTTKFKQLNISRIYKHTANYERQMLVKIHKSYIKIQVKTTSQSHLWTANRK